MKNFARDESGATVVEMAFALPILILFLYGIIQIGMIMAAVAGMQHALGEGARQATLYPTPADRVIKQRMDAVKFGEYLAPITTDLPTTDPTGKSYKDLAVHYTVTPNFLFFTAPSVTIDRTKRVYLSF